MSDKKKIVLLSFIIGFVSLLIILVGVIIFLSITSENKVEEGKLSTTARRTIKTSDSTQNHEDDNRTTTTTSSITTTTTSISSTQKTSNTPKTSTTKKKTTVTTSKKKKTTTTKKTTKKTGTTNSIIPYPDFREVTNEPTDYPNADDEAAWTIVNMINEERKKNGLNPLEVAVELRRLAEEAADFWYEYSDDEIKNYLYGHSNYRRKSNHLYTNSAYLSMYEATVQNTNVTTNKYLKYLGVGLIYRVNGIGGLATHYYVIIYE